MGLREAPWLQRETLPGATTVLDWWHAAVRFEHALQAARGLDAGTADASRAHSAVRTLDIREVVSLARALGQRCSGGEAAALRAGVGRICQGVCLAAGVSGGLKSHSVRGPDRYPKVGVRLTGESGWKVWRG